MKEGTLLDDGALRKRVVRALMSYHPLWLRLAVEGVLNRRVFEEPEGGDGCARAEAADLEAVLREELLSDRALLVRAPFPLIVKLICDLSQLSVHSRYARVRAGTAPRSHFSADPLPGRVMYAPPGQRPVRGRALAVCRVTRVQGGASLARRPHKRAALGQLLIHRLLLLILLLDRAPRHLQLPQDAPFLFRLAAPCKSSEAVLTECLQASLAGIGRLSKHLAKLGYAVEHCQTDVDEWPMQVAALGPDLSNGIVLCKLTSVLFPELARRPRLLRLTLARAETAVFVGRVLKAGRADLQDLMLDARRPSAGQRAVKVRNARLVLDALRRLGVDTAAAAANRGEAAERVDVRVDAVVGGHARPVLALLWAMAAESFARSVPVRQLRTEIALLERKLAAKGLDAAARDAALLPGNAGYVTDLLFRWARAVVGQYGVTVRSAATSFTDGSALCLLVHHYVPRLIDWTAIAIPPPVARDVAEAMLPGAALQGMESLSWSDNLGMQNSSVQHELEAHR